MLHRDPAELQAALTRANFLLFCRTALAPLNQSPAAHHRLLISKLQAVADGKCNRLMVTMPPGSAKTTYVSRLFPAWYFGHFPRKLCIIGASHTADLAESISKDVQGYVKDMGQILEYSLTSESVKGWRTTKKDEYKSAGVGGPITGRRADIAIIDDPVKDREEADSEVVREKQWKWYNSTLRSRLKPKGAVILVMTRWHGDDLGGRLLAAQRSMWDFVNLPAEALEDDPLGREPGEFLWGDDTYDYANELRETKAELELNGMMRDWGALYQQNPQPIEGSLFKTALIDILPVAPAGRNEVRAWDLASTKESGTTKGAYTVGVKLLRTDAGKFVVTNVKRFKGGPDEVEATIVNTAKQDGRGVRVGLPKDPGQSGVAQVLWLTRALAGYRVESSPETGDKAERAAPVASQCNVGNLALVDEGYDTRGTLSQEGRAFIDELASFPSGVYKDQVDALSRAFTMVGLNRAPMKITQEALTTLSALRR